MKEYQLWWGVFSSCADETNLSAQFKMLRPESCLEVETAETVKELDYSDHAYEAASARLNRMYGGNRQQFVLVFIGIEIPKVEHTIKGILLDTTMDSPARSSWLNIKQYNGYNGCCTCTEPGEQLDLGPGKKNARRQCHVYPFNKSFAQTTGHAKFRQHDEVKSHALISMSQLSERGKVSVSIPLYITKVS